MLLGYLFAFLAPTPDPAVIYAKHADSVVFVRGLVYRDDEPVKTSYGAGVVISGGRILTSCHVVRHGEDDALDVDAVEILIGKRDVESGAIDVHETIAAKKIRCDGERDLAIVRPLKGRGLPQPISVAKKNPRPGQAVVALGHSSYGLSWTVHACHVAGVGRPSRSATSVLGSVTKADAAKTAKKLRKREQLEVDCENGPMSGSPLLDASGSVVGLAAYITYRIRDKVPEVFNYYVAADEIREFLAEAG